MIKKRKFNFCVSFCLGVPISRTQPAELSAIYFARQKDAASIANVGKIVLDDCKGRAQVMADSAEQELIEQELKKATE